MSPEAPPPRREVVYDTEGNDLLPGLTRMHCIGIIDINTKERMYYGPAVVAADPWATPETVAPRGSVTDGLAFLETCDLAVAHNGYDYDRRAIEKLYPHYKGPATERDSLITAKVLWPYDALIGPDLKAIQAGRLPAKYMKAHSLAAWGYRLGEKKDDYTGGFAAWNPEMAKYMMQDCTTLLVLWEKCLERLGWRNATEHTYVWPELVLEIEHGCAEIVLQQETDGVHFNTDKAIELSRVLTNAQAAVAAELRAQFGAWWQPLDDPDKGKPFKKTLRRKMVELEGAPMVTIPRVGAKGQALKPYIGPPIEEQDEGVAWCRIEWTELNPGSRDHLTNRLTHVYGWKPKAFGKDGKPKLDETVIEEIPDHILPRVMRTKMLQYFKLTKTLGMLSVGNKSWVKMILGDGNKRPPSADGRMHGRMDTCGAITGRATHKDPNLSQVPAVRVDDAGIPLRGIEGGFGYECRELFEADPGWEQTGVDATALELITLGHYLAPIDGRAFSDRVCDPLRDAHTEHSDITGLGRHDTKTCTYLYIYGGTAWKLTFEIEVTEEEIPALLGYKGLKGLLSALRRRFGDEYVARYDDKAKALLAKARIIILKFEAGIIGIKELKEGVSIAAQRGWVKGMDGRKIFIRSPHAALNTLLQGAGAITCKLWMILTHKGLREAGLEHGRDYKQILWSHDELQFTHRPGLGPVIARIAKEALVEAGKVLGLRGVYRGEAKTGNNWAACH